MKQRLAWLYFFVFFFGFISVSFAQNGKKLFTKHCSSCHTMGKGRLVGPDLKGEVFEHSEAWLIEFITSPRAMLKKKDKETLELVAEYGLMMPDSNLSKPQIKEILNYLKEVEGKMKVAARKPHESLSKKYKQPINFSHIRHAGDHNIPCMLCHSGAKKSRHAGIPSANVCLNCHSQVKTDSPEIQKIHKAVKENKPLVWYKRHNLPDHAYFNHSRHVNAKVECQTCHGPVQNMVKPKPINITMGWCLKCHRDTDKRMKKQANVPKHKLNFTSTDCARCHH